MSGHETVVVEVVQPFKDKRFGCTREPRDRYSDDLDAAERHIKLGLVKMIERNPAAAAAKGPAPENKADGLNLENKQAPAVPAAGDPAPVIAPPPVDPVLVEFEAQLGTLAAVDLATLAE